MGNQQAINASSRESFLPPDNYFTSDPFAPTPTVDPVGPAVPEGPATPANPATGTCDYSRYVLRSEVNQNFIRREDCPAPECPPLDPSRFGWIKRTDLANEGYVLRSECPLGASDSNECPFGVKMDGEPSFCKVSNVYTQGEGSSFIMTNDTKAIEAWETKFGRSHDGDAMARMMLSQFDSFKEAWEKACKGNNECVGIDRTLDGKFRAVRMHSTGKWDLKKGGGNSSLFYFNPYALKDKITLNGSSGSTAKVPLPAKKPAQAPLSTVESKDGPTESRNWVRLM